MFTYNASDGASVYSNNNARTILINRHQSALADDADFQPQDFDNYVRDVYDLMSFSMTINGGRVKDLSPELTQLIVANIEHLNRYDAAVLTMAIACGNNFTIQSMEVAQAN